MLSSFVNGSYSNDKLSRPQVYGKRKIASTFPE